MSSYDGKSKSSVSTSESISERTPLLPPPPSAVDASGEADIDVESDAQFLPSHDGRATKREHKAKQSLDRWRAGCCAIGLACLISLQATNISLITTTQSAIAEELEAFDKVTWFTSAYLIAMSAPAPLNGKLASVFSPRICIFVSSIILAIGAGLCSVANDFGAFVFGRILTGIGASGIFSISIIITLELSSEKRRGLAIGLLNSGYTIGVAAGATIAGALLSVTGWRALFWMQVPIALFGGTVLLFSIPKSFKASYNPAKADEEEQSTLKRISRLDYFGAVTLTGSIVLVLYALSSPKKIPLFPIILSAVVLATFVLNEIHLAHDPIIPVTLLKSRGLLLTCLGTVGYMMARWSVLFYTPTYALAVRQWSPATAGSILIPTNGGFAIGGLLVGALHIRRHGSFLLASVIVYAIFPITLVLLATLSTEHSNPWLYVLIVALNGAVTGAALNYNLAHVLHLTPKSTHYVASSLLATFRGFAGSFGSAIGGGLFARTLYGSLEDGFAEHEMHPERLIRRLLGSPALVGSLSGVQKEVAVNAYTASLRTLWLAGAGLAVLMVFVQAGTGTVGADERETPLEQERQRLLDDENASDDRNDER